MPTSNTNGEICDGGALGTNDVKIVCVGLMRTGLESLHRAFEVLGYSDIYDQEKVVDTFELWDAVLKNQAPEGAFSTMFRGYDVVMGMPTFCFWEDIISVFPNAQVILTVRDETRWWTSTEKAKVAMDRDVPGAPLKYGTFRRKLERFLVPSYYKFCEVLRFSWATKLGASGLQGTTLNESAARSSFRQHNSYIKSHPLLVNQQTKQGWPKLLVMDPSEGWAPLCDFLGKDVPNTPFPSPADLRDDFFLDGKQAPEWFLSVTGFHSLFHPRSDFAIRIRRELLHGMVIYAVCLSILLVFILAAASFFAHISRTVVALVYLVVITVGWNTYGIMHRLIMRMPLLMVVPMTLQSLLIAASLHVCFISVGVLKEYLVTRDRIASPVLILSARMMSIIFSSLYLLLVQGHASLGAPIWSMSAFAFTNEASTWAGYEMLKYVSFPVQVLAKSCKMLPNMLMGRAINKTIYSKAQYAQAIAALVSVAVMYWSDEDTHDVSKFGNGKSSTMESHATYKLCMGIVMLFLFFACDSFTSQWQTTLYNKHPAMTETQMMLGGNLFGLILTSSTMVAAWPEIRLSLDVAMNRPEVALRILCLGVVSALGQFCIYFAIRKLGPLNFTWIMTVRQLLSVLISLIFFGHGVNIVKIVCIIVVFGVMSAKQLSQIPAQVKRKIGGVSISLRTHSFLPSFHTIKCGSLRVFCIARATLHPCCVGIHSVVYICFASLFSGCASNVRWP